MSDSRGRAWPFRAWMAASLLALVLVCSLSLGLGASHPALGRVWGICWECARSLCTGQGLPTDPDHTIVLQIRLVRVVLACLVGAALALSGTIMQALFQNPMADPYLLGISAGASLGAVAAMTMGIEFTAGGMGATSVLAFVGGLAIAAVVYALSVHSGRVHTGTLLLTGIALGSLVASLTSLMIILHDRDVHGVLFWLMGGLTGRRWIHVAALLPQVVLCAGVGIALSRTLNVLLMGDEQASNLGVNVGSLKKLLLALASLSAAGAVAVSGLIGFVGLIVPHLCRLWVGSDHRRLIPLSLVVGALLLVGADAAARVVVAPSELPLGIITSALGCPFFLYLLRRHGPRGM